MHLCMRRARHTHLPIRALLPPSITFWNTCRSRFRMSPNASRQSTYGIRSHRRSYLKRDKGYTHHDLREVESVELKNQSV